MIMTADESFNGQHLGRPRRPGLAARVVGKKTNGRAPTRRFSQRWTRRMGASWAQCCLAVLMRTNIDNIPPQKRRDLERVVQIIFEEFEDALALATQQWKNRGR